MKRIGINFDDILKGIDNYNSSYVLHKAGIPASQAKKIFNTNDIDKIKSSVVLNIVLLYMLENK